MTTSKVRIIAVTSSMIKATSGIATTVAATTVTVITTRAGKVATFNKSSKGRTVATSETSIK